MDYDLYLLYCPGKDAGWGVFDEASCPNTTNFPGWMYRQYTIPKEKREKVFRRLMEVQQRLTIEKITPAKGREKEIFPELSDLLVD